MKKLVLCAALLALVSCGGGRKKVGEGEISGDITLSGAFALYPLAVYPGGQRSTVKAINLGEADMQEARAGESVAVQLTDDIDIGRGDLLASGIAPTVASELRLQICWFNERALTVGGKYIVRHTTREVQGIVKIIDHRIDIETLREEPAERLEMNDIAAVTIKTSAPLAFDPYKQNRTTGSVVFIDTATFETVGAGIIL